MTTIRKIELESVSLFLLATIFGVVFAMYYNHSAKPRSVFSLPVMDVFATPTPTPPPTPKVETFSNVSPDGTKKLTMTVTPHATTSKTYAFSVSNADESNPQSIYSINLPIDETMNIPFNAFSPDDKFLFLEHNTRDGNEAFVFRASGDPMTDTKQYFNAPAIFIAHQTGNTYQETTGWASETLLIINTTLSNGDKGPSYWLEVPSKAVIQLSTQF
ncbi:MAG TPA: hypothetical protein VEW42_05630 [Candidatus Eisenbacteria bacterium]|nr:hypothetical protein [Candidatus Eisenbacteria bacterium]